LKPTLKWSDGSPITAKDFQASLERAKRVYPADLKALFDSVDKIEARSKYDLAFRAKANAGTNSLLLKLTEPMYSLLAIKNGAIDFTRSSGPYQIVETTQQSLSLVKNPHWFLSHPEMPERVEIRRPKKDQDLIQSFRSDDWANLVSGTSLIRAELLDELAKAGFKTWQRSLDRVFGLYPSQAFLRSGNAAVALHLARKLQPEQVLPGYGGFVRAEQYFPRGYELWSSKSPQLQETSAKPVKALTVIVPESPYAPAPSKGLSESIKSIAGIRPEIEIVPLSALDSRMKLGDFDFLATGIAVADPNFEGAMSFFFERKPPFIQSAAKPLDFSDQLAEARSLPLLKDRAARMREIILGAQEAGFVIPLFHYFTFRALRLQSQESTCQRYRTRMKPSCSRKSEFDEASFS
jgi:MarR-like DNA-binding transcriptional regulator SgrR of sgrS sRNA